MANDSVRPAPEPWLRGPLPGVHPLLAPALRAFEQASEDIAHWTAGLTAAQIWSRPYDLAPVGFHLRHIAGSVDRLTTYLRGDRLAPEQLETLREEMDPPAKPTDLLRAVQEALSKSAQTIRMLDPNCLTDARAVGRMQLPSTVIGLAIHLAEHTQRHVGELIITAKLAKKWDSGRTRPAPS
jgi:hypothetical protein